MTLPNVPASYVGREHVRTGGGYGAPAAGQSPAGGLDADNAGNLAMDGDLTVKGILHAGNPPQALTNAAGEVNGSRIQSATVGAAQIDPAQDYEVRSLEINQSVSGSPKLIYSGAHIFQIATTRDGNGVIDLNPDNDNGAGNIQQVRLFRASNPSAGDTDFLILQPGTTGIAFEVNAKTGDVWALANVSAASFTDRSAVYKGGDALAVLRGIRPENQDAPGDWADVDHGSLGPLLVERRRQDGTTLERDIGKQIQMNSAAILELLARVEALESK